MEIHKGILGCKGLELVRSSNKLESCLLGYLFSHCFGKTYIGIQACSDSCSSLGKF
jgi:hypothetical protein